MAIAVVLAAGVVGSLLLWPEGGGGGGETSADSLPSNPGLAELPFPDADALGFADGADAMCDTVNETMTARGYQPVDAKGGDGVSCWYITTGLSLLKDGSNNLNADISLWRGDIDSRYQSLLDKFSGQRDKQKKNPEFRVSKIERFPAGDDGFIVHQESTGAGSARTDTTAVFRSGEDLMLIAMWGFVQRISDSGEDQSNEPLTEEVTYGEITDIITALSGEGEPGEPRITKPDLRDNPALAGLTAPTLPTEGTAEEVCAAVEPAAKKINTVPDNADLSHAGGAPTYRCTFGPPPEPDEWPEGYSERELAISFVTHKREEAFRASETMGRDLLGLLNNTSTDDEPPSPLYRLPIGDIGYVLYHVPGYGAVNAAYLVDGRTYVRIEITGFNSGGGYGLDTLPEETLMRELVTVIEGLGRS